MLEEQRDIKLISTCRNRSQKLSNAVPCRGKAEKGKDERRRKGQKSEEKSEFSQERKKLQTAKR